MVRRWAVAVSLVCGAGALAQPWPAVTPTHGTPPPAPRYETTTPATDGEPVYVMRTAGQNDRTVKVVRPPDPSDPGSLAEVKDTATGQTFVIPGKVLAKLPKATPTGAEPPQLPEAKPKQTPPPDLPPLPITAQRTTPPAVAPTPPTERMVTTWNANDPPAKSAVPASAPASVPSAVVPSVAVAPAAKPGPSDPWRASGEPKAVAPTPRAPAAEPKLTPVPTWRAPLPPTPPGASDPWRPTGGSVLLAPRAD